MSYNATLTNYAQSIYLEIKNRYFDDIASDDGQTFISYIIDWTNQYIDELENITDPYGQPVDWKFLRQYGYSLGTATFGQSVLTGFDGTVLELIAEPGRYVLISDATGIPVSQWEVVSPNQLINGRFTDNIDRVSFIGGNLIFSRAFNALEDGLAITGDVTISIPRLSIINQKALTIVKPKQLLILGVGKNATLPDIIQGVLSPSYVQKYNDLLASAIIKNNASSQSDIVEREKYGYIGGVGYR